MENNKAVPYSSKGLSQPCVKLVCIMRTPEYLSPSGISCYLQDPLEYYRRYLSDVKVSREMQSKAMAIGSAFDAYVKAYLYKQLFGKPGSRNNDPRFEFETLFDAQVTAFKDWALANGKYVFEQYLQSGCLADLMLELNCAQGEPRFEFDLKGIVNSYREGLQETIGEVVLMGKPDAHFITKEGVHCILDFKVNNYVGLNHKSPSQYYLRMRSAGCTNHGQHKKCVEADFHGTKINSACGLEEIDEYWARQLAIYAWLTGNPVGSDFVAIIHQLVCNPTKGYGLPSIRIAEHVNLIAPEFQHSLYNKACDIWETVRSDWIFRDMSREESQAYCKITDELMQDTDEDKLCSRAR
jgi:hypothetical protein